MLTATSFSGARRSRVTVCPRHQSLFTLHLERGRTFPSAGVPPLAGYVCARQHWYRPFSRQRVEYWDTRTALDGEYMVTVTAWGIRGNKTSSTIPVIIANRSEGFVAGSISGSRIWTLLALAVLLALFAPGALRVSRTSS